MIIHYTVQAGNTLSGIAARFGTTYQVLAADNHIANPNLIFVGESVYIPSGSSQGLSQQSPSPITPAASPSSLPPATGSFQSCVISRESGGNPKAVNPSSGAGGLYQFLPSTWVSLGYSGSPQDASVAVQNQAFQKLYAEDGTSPWAPSDGCS